MEERYVWRIYTRITDMVDLYVFTDLESLLLRLSFHNATRTTMRPATTDEVMTLITRISPPKVAYCSTSSSRVIFITYYSFGRVWEATPGISSNMPSGFHRTAILYITILQVCTGDHYREFSKSTPATSTCSWKKWSDIEAFTENRRGPHGGKSCAFSSTFCSH